MEGGLVLSWGTVFGILGFLLTFGTNMAVLAVWGGGINARLKQVESHSDKVDQIAPLQAQLAALKESVGIEFKNMRDDVRELAQSVRDLAHVKADH